jgi:uncharacterized repeat protein (TIGR03833 family)
MDKVGPHAGSAGRDVTSQAAFLNVTQDSLDFLYMNSATRSIRRCVLSNDILRRSIDTMNRQGRSNRNRGNRNHKQPQAISRVPNTQQVVPGASVSVVLKADQPTGKEVQGIVRDLLTRGEHPRGIKVRLQDGRIGRVQRMATPSQISNQEDPVNEEVSATSKFRGGRQPRDVREEQYSQGPSPRTLADFLPLSGLE